MTKRGVVVELEELRERLREAEQTLAAIRSGEVDSLIISGPHGDHVFSLKGAEQPYRIFVEQMLEGAVTLAEDGTILYCNRRFADMMRLRMEKVVGSPMQAFVRPEDHADLAAILSSLERRKARYVLAAADGTFIPTQLAFSRLPMDQQDGGVNATCVVVTDLTEQEEKRELATALQDLRVAQRQLKQQNEELAHARAAAEAASEAKDNFLAALSHELRTPLTPVLLTVAAMERDASLSNAARQDISLLRRNIELEARLIDDLLDLTSIARGKVELRPDVIDLHTALTGALDICRADMAAKAIQLSEEFGAARAYVRGDPIRLQQIFWNLIRNAVKFTPAGGRITVRSANDDGRLLVTVTDTGIGIEGDAMIKIFSPFEQADRVIAQRFGGLGLGLTISKRLVELHDGTLWAHSDGRDRGSTFTVVLPVVEAAAALPTGATSSAAAPATANEPALRSLRILLVEDHDDTRRSMSRLLGRSHVVRDANSVASALRIASGEPFDVVISDLGLPDGSGLDLMRQLRERYHLQGICLSGFGMEEDIARSADAGFRHHLTKPVDLRKLESVIQTFGR
jgi:PAS domain S-box-containing protein